MELAQFQKKTKWSLTAKVKFLELKRESIRCSVRTQDLQVLLLRSMDQILWMLINWIRNFCLLVRIQQRVQVCLWAQLELMEWVWEPKKSCYNSKISSPWNIMRIFLSYISVEKSLEKVHLEKCANANTVKQESVVPLKLCKNTKLTLTKFC